MTLLVTIVVIALGLCAAMAAAWALAIGSGQSGWVDAIWSFAIGLAGAAAALLLPGEAGISARQWLVAVLVVAWSLRLGLHIVTRTLHSEHDDPRYSQLRKDWGERFKQRLFLFLQIQAAAALALVLSVMAAAHNPAPGLGIGDIIGVAMMAAAVIGEAVADRQLTAFRADAANKGKVCDVGLWGMSRHPNYFFEWLGWLAYAVIAINLSGIYPWGWGAIVGPVLMYVLLVYASGIPPLEAHMLRSRGDQFRRYQQRVNAFWPWPSTAAAGRERRAS